MNERFMELANEANKDIGYEFRVVDSLKLHELMGKFAGLIINECIESVKEDIHSCHITSDFSTGYDAALENAICNITEKFGV